MPILPGDKLRVVGPFPIKDAKREKKYNVVFELQPGEDLVLFETTSSWQPHIAQELVWRRFAQHLLNKIQRVRKEFDDCPAEDTDCKNCGTPREGL